MICYGAGAGPPTAVMSYLDAEYTSASQASPKTDEFDGKVANL